MAMTVDQALASLKTQSPGYFSQPTNSEETGYLNAALADPAFQQLLSTPAAQRTAAQNEYVANPGLWGQDVTRGSIGGANNDAGALALVQQQQGVNYGVASDPNAISSYSDATKPKPRDNSFLSSLAPLLAIGGLAFGAPELGGLLGGGGAGAVAADLGGGAALDAATGAALSDAGVGLGAAGAGAGAAAAADTGASFLGPATGAAAPGMEGVSSIAPVTSAGAPELSGTAAATGAGAAPAPYLSPSGAELPAAGGAIPSALSPVTPVTPQSLSPAAASETPAAISAPMGSPGGGGAGGVAENMSMGLSADGTPLTEDQLTGSILPAAGAAGTSGIQQALSALKSYGPLGLTATNLLMNKGAQNKFASQMANVGSTQTAAANTMLSDAQAGKVNPADAYNIKTWADQAKAQAKQYYASAGLSDSSMATQAMADIDARANGMVQNALQTQLTTALNQLNISDQNQINAIKAEMAANSAAGTQGTAFLNALALYSAGPYSKTAATPAS